MNAMTSAARPLPGARITPCGGGGASCLVLVPAYSAAPSAWELHALRNNLAVLRRWPVALLAPEDFDASAYYDVAARQGAKLGLVGFPAQCFRSVPDYNRLCLSLELYERVRAYDYVLIMQLDAWLFCDEVGEWLAKGYDYVGAPVYAGVDGCERPHLAGVGNGGLSLRRVAWCRTVVESLCGSGIWLTPRGAVEYQTNRWFWDGGGARRAWHYAVRAAKMMFGWRNTRRYWQQHSLWDEDQVLSFLAARAYGLQPRLPSATEAATFAFDKEARCLFALTGRLPMGCHAFRRYEWAEFWTHHIPEPEAPSSTTSARER